MAIIGARNTRAVGTRRAKVIWTREPVAQKGLVLLTVSELLGHSAPEESKLGTE